MPEGEKVKKPIYKKWWFWLIIIVVIIGIAGSSTNTTNTSSNDTYTKNTAVEVTIIDFSTISRDEVQVWFDNNKINGTIKEEVIVQAGGTNYKSDKMLVLSLITKLYFSLLAIFSPQ